MWLFFFYLLLVARLRFSLVYLCVKFVFSAAVLHFLVRWMSRLIALWSKGVYIPFLHFFCENKPELWPVFFVHWQMKASFSTTIMGCYTSENNCSGQWRRESTGHMYDIMGLPDLASDGSPLFAEPMFLFGWALCNTSLHVNLLTELRELCSASLLHRPLQDIFTFALFWLPRINLSLQNQLSYYTISFSWSNSLLEPRFLCDECSVNLHDFFLRR